MGTQIELDSHPAPIHFVRRPPGPVRRLNAAENRDGSLKLFWEAPAGITRVDGYRIERTPEGQTYELIGETPALEFTIAQPVPGEPWFYRVTAFNLRGAGEAKQVFFHRRACRLHPRGPDLECISMPIPIIPGVQVNISEPDWESP